jgi:hypothetical protein
LSFRELISDVTDQRFESLQFSGACSESQAAACHTFDSPNFSNTFISFDTLHSPAASSVSSAPNKPISLSNTTLLEMNDPLISIRADFINEKDTGNNPRIFKDINISHLFKKYQTAVSKILIKQKTLPVESYVHELASLTHVFFPCKNQHSQMAERNFSLDLRKDLTISLESKTMKHNLGFLTIHLITIIATITTLALAKTTRE